MVIRNETSGHERSDTRGTMLARQKINVILSSVIGLGGRKKRRRRQGACTRYEVRGINERVMKIILSDWRQETAGMTRFLKRTRHNQPGAPMPINVDGCTWRVRLCTGRTPRSDTGSLAVHSENEKNETRNRVAASRRVASQGKG